MDSLSPISIRLRPSGTHSPLNNRQLLALAATKQGAGNNLTLHIPAPGGTAHSDSRCKQRRDYAATKLTLWQPDEQQGVARIMTTDVTSCIASLEGHMIYTNAKSLPPGCLSYLPVGAAHQD
ncbi:hypothetical protein E2C01_089652 [Portunus trituberculatus]|uniref:Uncharacterized protein n=1 Tax=Portunus trituberculatus TaxID=210409 RepID=A0A5B7J9D4_PORTR|nr:hypothetical protein [Portunus trituberculatus]